MGYIQEMFMQNGWLKTRRRKMLELRFRMVEGAATGTGTILMKSLLDRRSWSAADYQKAEDLISSIEDFTHTVE